jgi:hypothetical protein
MSLALGRRSDGPEMHTEPSRAQRSPKTGADTVATFFSRSPIFGGSNRSTLFVTDSTHGNVLMHALDAPGVVLHGLLPTNSK